MHVLVTCIQVYLYKYIQVYSIQVTGIPVRYLIPY